MEFDGIYISILLCLREIYRKILVLSGGEGWGCIWYFDRKIFFVDEEKTFYFEVAE